MMNTAGKTTPEINNLFSWRKLESGQTVTTGQFWISVLLFSLAAILFQIGAHFLNYTDYVGPDPDDAMRLVEVRDYLGGQGWFDLHQYRLGPDGGTLMHGRGPDDWHADLPC